MAIPRNPNSVFRVFFKEMASPTRNKNGVVYNSSASNCGGLNRGRDSAENNEVGNLHDRYDNIITFYIL